MLETIFQHLPDDVFFLRVVVVEVVVDVGAVVVVEITAVAGPGNVGIGRPQFMPQ